MNSTKLALTFAALFALQVGCAASEGPSSSEADVIAAPGASAGQTCAGFAGLRCAEGLACVIPEHDPHAADVAGTCQPRLGLGAVGSTCAGIANLACNPGLFCDVTATHPDASGTCIEVKPGGLGSLCGGIAGLRCSDGLRCTGVKDFPDASGTCLR